MGLIISKNNDLYIVKLYKNKMQNIDIFNIDDISILFKKVLVKLKNKYDISGFCLIEVFVNEYYGMIVEIDNIDKYGKDIDVNIKFHIDSLFMNEINDYDMDRYEDCYFYKNKYYSTYKNINDSEVIYKEAYRIIKEGIKIK